MISLNAINAKCKLDPIVIYPTPLIIIEFKCAIYLQNAGKKEKRFDFDVFFSAKYVWPSVYGELEHSLEQEISISV